MLLPQRCRRGAQLAALMLCGAGRAEPGAAQQPAPVQLCAQVPAATVEAAFAAAGSRVTVSSASGGAGQCVYRFQGVRRGMLLEVSDAGAAADARDGLQSQLQALRAQRGVPAPVALTGIGDEAYLSEGGAEVATSVLFRWGRMRGVINVGASPELSVATRGGAARALARSVTEAHAGSPVAAAPQPPAPTAVAQRQSTAATSVSAVRAQDFEAVSDSLDALLPHFYAALGDSAEVAAFLAGANVAPIRAALADRQRAIQAERARWSDSLHAQHVQELRRRAATASSPGTAAPVPGTSRPGGVRSVHALSSAERRALRRMAARLVGSPDRTLPSWYRETRTTPLEMQHFGGDKGVDVSGGVSHTQTRFFENWKRGTDSSAEMVIEYTSHDDPTQRITDTKRYRNSVEIPVCPNAAGVLAGTGTAEFTYELRFRRGARMEVVRAIGRSELAITARVGDDARLQSYDVEATTRASFQRTSHGGYLPINVEGGGFGWRKIGIDPRIAWLAQDDGDSGYVKPESRSAIGGEESWQAPSEEDFMSIVSAVGDSRTVEIAVNGWRAGGLGGLGMLGLAEGEIHAELIAAHNSWYNGDCVQTEISREPHATRLEFGQAQAIEGQAWHKAEERAVEVPVRAHLLEHGDVSPREAPGTATEHTFTAPSRTKVPDWQETTVELGTRSRRGRTAARAAVTFTRKDAVLRYRVRVQQSTHAEKLGEVSNITVDAILQSAPGDPSTLVASGTFSGHVVGHVANCLSQENKPSPRDFSGRLDPETSTGAVLDFGREKTLIFALTGKVPPQSAEEEASGMNFTGVQRMTGVPVPRRGQPVTLSTVTPGGFVGVISSCSGEVQTIEELTIEALSEG